MEHVLDAKFFRRPVLDVSEDLLGKYLVRKRGKKTEAAMITEVEAYDGPQDKACHAHRGCTPRNAPMFGPAGHWYIYLIYGMYWMLNIVTGEEGYPAAVLIRGTCPESGRRAGDLNGPGKLTKSLGIHQAFNAKVATASTGLWIENRGVKIPSSKIQRTPRIGVDYAGAWAKKPYRFVLRENENSQDISFDSRRFKSQATLVKMANSQ